MALIELKYCSYIGTNKSKTVVYDDIQHKIVSGTASNDVCTGLPPSVLYEHIVFDEVTGLSWKYTVYPNSVHPYAYVMSAPHQGAISKPVIENVAVTPATPPQSNGVVEVTASTFMPPLRYKLDTGSWQSSNVFTGVAAGVHTITVSDSVYGTSLDNAVSQEVTVGPIGDVKITAVDVVDATTEEGGMITITATTSSHPIYYSIDGGNTWDWRNIYADLAPGTYHVFARDNGGAVDSRTVYVHQPFAVAIEPYINVPEVNALRFVFPVAPGFGGLLHLQERHAGFYQKPYFLPVQQSDPTVLQIQSSYETNTLEVRALDNTLVHTFTAEKKSDNLGQEVTVNGVLAAAGSMQTKMFFPGTIGLPDVVREGNLVRITGTVNMDGVYNISEVVPNPKVDFPYFLINIGYKATGPNASCTAQFLDAVLPYEAYEFAIDWTAVPPGRYNLLLKGVLMEDTYTAYGEPIDLRPSWPYTVLLSYKNIDNNYGIDYTTGLEHVIRFAGKFFERTNSGQKETHRDSKNRLVKVSAWKQRQVKLEAWRLPPWVHERLELAFDHDYFTINGVEYQTGEDYDWTYHEDYSLVDGEITVTQVNDYFNENSDDSGDVDSGYLRVNEGYLKI